MNTILILSMCGIVISILFYLFMREKKKHKSTLHELQKTNQRIDEKINEGIGGFIGMLITQSYDARVDLFRYLNKKTKKGGILFVGDSLTHEFPFSEIDFHTNLPIYNRGIGGDTTEGLLNRMKESIDDVEPKQVFLLIGTNDLAKGSPIDQIVSNIEKIIVHIQSNHSSSIYIQSLYPTSSNEDTEISQDSIQRRANVVIQEVNKRITQLCIQREITFLDVYPFLCDQEGKLNPEFSRDGLHLNSKGYDVVVNILSGYIQPS